MLASAQAMKYVSLTPVLLAVILFWVAWQSLDAASWGTILLLVSVVGGVLGVYLGRQRLLAARGRRGCA